MKWYERLLTLPKRKPLEFIEGLLYSELLVTALLLIAPAVHIASLTHGATLGLWGTDYAKYIYVAVLLLGSLPGLAALLKTKWSAHVRHKARAFSAGVAFLMTMFLGVLSFAYFGNGWSNVILSLMFGVIYLHSSQWEKP